MDLSNDLISKFVKITNDDKNKNSESTVYGTVVEYNGGMYVRIDGSDLLTPVETTADFKPDERVTVMIKNHSATVTGNITSPATNEGAVTKKVTEAVEDVEGKVITEVEILIADRVSTKQLDAEVARIDTLIAGKATIEELEAVDAKIENLEVENLKAINAEIENLKANKAEIGELKATTAEIEILDAKVATIDTLINGNLTSDNILSFNITSQNTTMANAFIKDAMIDSITANKIMSGVIDTNNVRVQSTDGSLLIQGTLIQMKDEDGKVRIQIGKDTGGNFTFILYDKSGTGVLIDEDGIKSSNAIADGLIVDAKVADNANISGSKLDIASVITEVNNDNSTTIKSNKIYLDEQNQSLEVAFNSLKTQVETIQDVTIDGDLTAVVEQVQSNTTKIEANKEGISTLVAENTIRKEEIQNLNGEIEGVNNTLSSKYSSLEQDVSGFKTTVADTYTTKSEFNNLEVGGRNLLENSSFKNDINKWIANGSSFYSFVINEGRQCCKIDMTKLNYGYTIRQSILTDLVYGETYTVSGWVKTENIRQGTTNYELMFYIDGWYDNNGVDTWYGLCRKGFPISTGTGSWQHISGTFTVDNPAFRLARNCDFYVYARDFTGQVYFYDVKLEKGNKATDWSPAPEDIQGQIDATNANIQNNYSTTSAMNSAIQQKANEITSSVSQTYATKQSVTDVSNNLAYNYSTTTQMNSAINQKANEITSSVSQTYTTKSEFNNLEVGGRNLLENSSFKKDVSKWTPNVSNFYSFVTNDGKQCCKIDMTKLNHIQLFNQSILTDLVYGETYTVSGWVKTENIRQGTTNYCIMFYIDGHYNKNGTDTWYGLGDKPFPINTGTGSWQHISWTFTVNSEGFKLARSCNFYVYARDFTGQVYFYDIKLEKGNKATDWTPSPEDVQEQIDATNTNLQNNYSTTTQMNSAINQKANQITSSVSQTYATKQSVTDVSNNLANNLANNYSTTTQMNSAIDQKANQITNSVSRTYATKQSVTDVSNNLTNNYSTTSQMNSIIQQTASDLTLKFSESGGYNLLQNGHADKGTSYWQDIGGGINVSSGASGNATGNFFVTSLPKGIRYYDWVKLLPNTHYVYQAKVWTDITFNGKANVPLHFYFSYDGANNTSDGYTVLDYQQNVPNTGKWIQCYVHFVTGTVSIYFKPFIYNDLVSTSKFYVTELMLSQSRVVQPWSPHPSEVYSGITRIDKDGVTVYHNNANGNTRMSTDGFFINNNGTDVVRATANGLYVQGNITSGSTIQGSTIEGSRIIGSEFIGNGTGNRVCINNGDYEVQTGNTSKGFFGLRTLDDDGREIPRLALGSSGLKKNSHNYFAITHYPANNNPLNANQTYADMTYRTHNYTTSDTSGDISNIRMLDDGDIHLAPVRNLLIKSSFSGGSHNSNTDETTLAEFGTFNGDYARYMETACIRRNGTNKGLILANYNDNGYNAMVRICIDSSNYRFFAPLNSAADISLGSPSYLWQRVCAANGTINTSDRNLKDNIEYIQETLNPKARKSESYNIKDMYDFVKDELSMVTYTMKDDEEQKLKYGFIAQDIINTKIGENIVYQVNDEESSFLGYDTMNYTSTLAGALKQTINEIENLKKEIEELKARLAALEHNKEDM